MMGVVFILIFSVLFIFLPLFYILFVFCMYTHSSNTCGVCRRKLTFSFAYAPSVLWPLTHAKATLIIIIITNGSIIVVFRECVHKKYEDDSRQYAGVLYIWIYDTVHCRHGTGKYHEKMVKVPRNSQCLSWAWDNLNKLKEFRYLVKN